MAEEVFQQWLAQRAPGSVNSEKSIRATASAFAKRRLADPAQVREVVQIALGHFLPYRTHHGRHAADLQATTVDSVLETWLSKPRADSNPHNIRQAARTFALRRGLNAEDAQRVATQAAAALATDPPNQGPDAEPAAPPAAPAAPAPAVDEPPAEPEPPALPVQALEEEAEPPADDDPDEIDLYDPAMVSSHLSSVSKSLNFPTAARLHQELHKRGGPRLRQPAGLPAPLRP